MNPIRTRKLGHLVLMVRDLEQSTRFYTEVMGLKVSDRIADQMVFLRAGEDHHDLALSRLPEDSAERDDLPRYTRPGLEHFSYYVESLDEMKRAVDVARSHGVMIERGIGQHGPGGNWFLVFKDPDGNNVEIYTDMERIATDAEHEPQTWARNLESFDRHRLEHFVVAPPAAMLAAKNGKRPAKDEDKAADPQAGDAA
ncbi:glyoxalase/bleomycin resistance protein/dihydroxybiphenyl dioxygenase [Cupriavidus basilensis OR16]|uniref:Glyoxalase/bleomycin resistance protein/dihydroxybiphenyl dioxygenase n=1 Tax=Cupriavidus basilensis OR16 TaxID=1127483 RepID=H1SDW6_9BURK|nr:VOC family protein [Cupriavidus basilensis]EHP39225.1 glyoxalase/bleomycin resistance protein/dihydroxybiphenyl dioxygenase [Cupriavidus basilensis OR16]